MNHRKLPQRIRGLAVTRVGVLASILVVVLVAVLAWASTWAVTDEGDGGTATQESRTQPSGTDEGGEESGSGSTDDGAVGETEHEKELEKSVKRFRAAQRKLAERVSQQLERRNAPFEFRVATYNVLGASHTGPGGRPGYPDAGTRMDVAVGALRSNDVDVVGFQEFESTQYGMFTARAGEYSLYPGLALGTKSVRFNIAWRSSVFQMVEARTLAIPYAGGSRIEMPVVLLESLATKRRVWVANFHNPADTPNLGNNARWRAEAAGIELAYLSDLHQQAGDPVVVTGDFNERAEIFCRFTASGVFSAAAGGSNSGGCSPPPNMQVDWIFGSTGVAFSSYAATDTGRSSDHNLVNATATLVAVAVE